MFVKFPSIEQFRNVCKFVRSNCDYHAIDYPTLTFTGKVKLHGTNACVAKVQQKLVTQSRSRIITPDDDNAGFSGYVDSHEEVFMNLLNSISPDQDVRIYGEWCGGNIQKSVALNQLDKMFVVFRVVVDEEIVSIPDLLGYNDIKLYSIDQFKSFEKLIDFAKPEQIIDELIAITEDVEKECPVGKAFGVSGIGEGVVWTSEFRGNLLTFKVKGEKHSSSKVKKLATVDTEKVNSVNEFVQTVLTESRLSQGIDIVFKEQNIEPDIKLTGSYIKWIMNDVLKEESDTLEDSGLTKKDVNAALATTARKWFMKQV